MCLQYRVYMKKYLFVLLPFIAGVLVYIQTAAYGFVYDDNFFRCREEYKYIASIPLAFQLPYSACVLTNGIYRPLPATTFILTSAVFGDKPMPHHIVNIVLHGFISSVIYVLLHKTLSIDKKVSIFVALLFAVLPIHSEVVANIKSRDELLAALFFLVMWMTYEQGKKKKYWYVLSGICFLFALLSKETAVVFPFILAAVAFIKRPRNYLKILTSLIIFIPGAFLYSVLRSSAGIASVTSQAEFGYVFNPLVYEPIQVRLFSALSILAIYAEKIVVPIFLSASYHFAHFQPVADPLSTVSWVVGLGLGVTLIVLMVIHSRKKDAVAVGICIFAFTYIPVSQTIFVGGDVIGERWMYLPSFGLLLVIVWYIKSILRYKEKYYIAAILILLCLYTVRTMLRNPVWASNDTLYQSMTQNAPKSVRGYVLHANRKLLVDQDIDAAKTQLFTAYTMYSDDAELNTLLGQVALMEGKYDDARFFLTTSSRLDPKLAITDRYWAQLLYVEKDYSTAYKHIRNVIDNTVYQWNDIFIYVAILTKLEQFDEAWKWLNTVSPAQKDYSQIQYIRAVLLYKTGKKDEAKNIIWDPSLTLSQRVAMFEEF